MTMDDDRTTDERRRRGSEALLVLLVFLLAGATVIIAADRIFDLRPELGNILFAVLPLIAAIGAATRLHQGD